MRRGHRTKRALSFKVHINLDELPSDFPFDYSDSIHWSIEAHRVFDEILDWRNIEVGEPIEVYGQNGRYKGFEIFGLTPRGSACRMHYVEEQLAWTDRRLEGVISARTHHNAEEDVHEIREAFAKANPAFNFTVDTVRKYP